MGGGGVHVSKEKGDIKKGDEKRNGGGGLIHLSAIYLMKCYFFCTETRIYLFFFSINFK